MTASIEFGMSDGHSEPHMTVGRDETLVLLKSLVTGATTAHQVHTPEIDLSGEEARVIWAVQDRVVFDNGMSVTGDVWKTRVAAAEPLITDIHHVA
jgi:SnoaL-like domain